MMKKEKVTLASDLRLLEVKILKANVVSPFQFDIRNIEGHNFEATFEMAFDLEKKLIKSEISISVVTKSKLPVEEEANGAFSFAFMYQYDKLEDSVTKVDDKSDLVVAPYLGNALSSITYSTARGILMTRFQGTGLSTFILPVIDPNILLTGSV